MATSTCSSSSPRRWCSSASSSCAWRASSASRSARSHANARSARRERRSWPRPAAAEIYRAALKAVRALFDHGAAARLCLVEDGELIVVAAEGALEPRSGTWHLSAKTAADLLAEPPGGVVLMGEMREDLRLGPEHVHAHVLAPRPCAATPRGLLVVTGATRDLPGDRSALQSAPARAGHADLAGAGERGADRGGPPARERGALRLARPARQRPHHRARRRRPRSSTRAPRSSAFSATRPEEVVGTRFDHFLRSRREEPSAAPAGRRWLLRRQRDRGPRVLAAPPGRDAAPVRGPAHEPAGGRGRPRDRPQQPRRQRAQGLRGAARPPGLPRPGHQPGQPRAVRGARAPRRRAQPSRAQRHRGHLPRPRRLQDDQRQPRPRRRRRGAQGGRRAPGHQHPRHRHRRALRRRRVRDPARGRRQRAGGGRHRRAHPRLAPGAAAPGPEGDRRALQPRHLGRRGRVARRRRRAHPQRRRRDVHRQARRQGRLPPVRAGDARGRARAPGAARRSAARDGHRPARAALPAAGPPGGRLRLRAGGAAALAPPRARAGRPRRVHAAGRGDGPDRADRALGAARGLPPGQGHPGAGAARHAR